MNLPMYCPEALPSRLVRQAREQSGIAFTLHLPEELDLGTFHGAMREGYLNRALQAVRWAWEAGIPLVNMHLNAGVYYTLPERRVYVYDTVREQFRGNLLRSIEVLRREAERAGAALCVENTGQWHLPHLAEPLQEMLDTGLVWLTWDTGHDGAAGLADRPFIHKNRSRLRHMHLNDYAGDRCHLPLYTGDLDVAGALAAAGSAQCAVIVEVKTVRALEESVIRLRQEELGIGHKL